ncbi:MAG TPA: VIT1/CCC1 transporter family protein [Bacteroidia bacterium]|nr:VIT1/CCC1 transporter family protein [Bacteroidia bacterium]
MTHLHPHQEKHFQGSEMLSDIVIGMSDGLTVPFALAAGVSQAGVSNAVIVTAVIAEIVAGAIAMGLGGYLAGQTEREHYLNELKREYDEVEHLPDREKQEIKEILSKYNISENVQNQLVEELCKDKDKWVDFMMQFELGLSEPDINRAKKSAFNIGLSYVVGGIVPLIPYIITDEPMQGFIGSVIITSVALLIFGYIKSKVTGQHPFKGALKTTLVGLLAASAAYFVAKLF